MNIDKIVRLTYYNGTSIIYEKKGVNNMKDEIVTKGFGIKFLKKIRSILIVLLCVIFVLCIFRISVQLYRKVHSEKRNEISKIVSYNLNGKEQTVLVEGKQKELPILIMVHGGPGFPVPFNEGCRDLFPEITDQFLTVYWDQFGCGKNRKINEDEYLLKDITIDDFVKMLKDLITNLNEDYPNHKVYLFGFSWGTILTAKVAAQYPELVDGVLVYGQFLRDMFQTQDIFDEIEKNCNNEEVKQFLNDYKTKENLTDAEIFKIEGFINQYTDGFIYHGKTGKKQSNSKMIETIFKYLGSPDYRLSEVIGCLTDSSRFNDLAMIMIHSDISNHIESIQVPYKILQGEKDLQTSRYQIETFVNSINNPNISIEIVPDCGHIPTTECFQRIIEEIHKLKAQ